MLGKIYKELLIILLVFLGGIALFTYLKLEPELPSSEVSIEDEEKLGELLTELMFSDLDEIKNPFLDSVVFEISNRLESNLGTTDYQYQFHLIKSDQVNAFATLGGHIFIHSELIKVTENAEELAAILAHEIGHVENRHVVDRMVTELGMTLIFSILSGNDPVLVSELLQMTVSNTFSRSQETQADQFGLELLEKSEISPLYMAHAFRKLKAEHSANYTPEILSTHPNINARIRRATSYPIPEGFSTKSLNIDWEKAQDQVQQLD